MSVSAWVYWRSGDVAPDRIFSRMGNNGNRGYELSIDDTPDGQLAFFGITSDGTDATGASAVESTKFPQGRWVHVVGTYTPIVSVNVYRDVVLVGSDTTSVPASQFVSSLNPNIGRRPVGTSNYNGLIDDVRVYNRALSGVEIKRLYSIGATLHVNTTIS